MAENHNINNNHVTVVVGGQKQQPSPAGCGVALLVVLGVVLLCLGIAYPPVGVALLVAVVVLGVVGIRNRRKCRRIEAERRTLVTRKSTRKAELEKLATVGPTGVCGFCGALEQHRDGYGRPYYPLAWHQAEIDKLVSETP